MRFLFISDAGDSLGFALKVKDEGNKVLFWTKHKRFEADRPLVETVPTIERGLDPKPDAIIIDMVGMGEMADSLKKRGFNVFGGGVINDKLEDDRDFAIKAMESAGIKNPPHKTFSKNSINEALKFVESSKKRYVFKPKGKAWSNLTYMAKDSEDMAGFLHYVKESGAVKGDFILQEFIEGTELAVNMHFFEGDPIYPADFTIERKKLLTGDLGPSTGCSASVLWMGKSRDSLIIKQTFQKLFPWLKAQKYTGPLDINTIVNDKGAHFLENTPRFGYSSHYCWASMVGGDLGKVLYSFAAGKVKEIGYEHPVSFGLRITIPPYPLDPYDEKNWPAFDKSEGHLVADFPEKNAYLLDVEDSDHGLVTGGSDGLVMEIVYAGKSLDDLEKKVYDAAKALKLPDKQYRLDGAQKARDGWPKLKSLGYEVPI